MKETQRKIRLLGVILAIVISMVGCGEGESPAGESNSNDEAFKIEDILWSIDEGIVDGNRTVLFEYTNNSPFMISSFKLTFKERADITEDEKNSTL